MRYSGVDGRAGLQARVPCLDKWALALVAMPEAFIRWLLDTYMFKHCNHLLRAVEISIIRLTPNTVHLRNTNANEASAFPRRRRKKKLAQRVSAGK